MIAFRGPGCCAIDDHQQNKWVISTALNILLRWGQNMCLRKRSTLCVAQERCCPSENSYSKLFEEVKTEWCDAVKCLLCLPMQRNSSLYIVKSRAFSLIFASPSRTVFLKGAITPK
ncbi:hypothetical protein CLV42_102502 [Chitinophaga ginsengisoli]|uniref:Uncharacterized protein n=1 Tax=Chitinophaga ginsengisoli TaxID=363837 RepID=A0A2P8GLT2_9BACT|nr:hypothetical protein CLV42_102502 [Chitinophaga ginsengisoli]